MTFPYTGWVLMPSFKPVELTFVERSRLYRTWHKAENGKIYPIVKIHSSKHAAIDDGHAELIKQQIAVEKRQANINKRRATLEKAAGESNP